MRRLGRFLLIAVILLVLTGGLFLTDHNMRRLQGAEEGCLTLDGKTLRQAAVRASAYVAALMDDCCGRLQEAKEALTGNFGK